MPQGRGGAHLRPAAEQQPQETPQVEAATVLPPRGTGEELRVAHYEGGAGSSALTTETTGLRPTLLTRAIEALDHADGPIQGCPGEGPDGADLRRWPRTEEGIFPHLTGPGQRRRASS